MCTSFECASFAERYFLKASSLCMVDGQLLIFDLYNREAVAGSTWMRIYSIAVT
jgi:hypothetical protein